MNELQVFTHNKFGQVRTIDVDGKQGLVATDVAIVLGYKNPSKAINDHCKGVTKRYILTNGGNQLMNIIFEPDLYRLIAHSNLPGAEEFESWIFDEVLPTIRKTGGYIPVGEADTEMEILAKAMVIANKTISEQAKRLGKLHVENSQLTVDNQIMQPKADYFDELVDRNLLTSFRDTSKELKVGEKLLIGFLLEHKYVYRDKKGKLTPYASKNSGLFEVKECYNEKTNWSGVQTLITPKGRETFRLLLEGMKIT